MKRFALRPLLLSGLLLLSLPGWALSLDEAKSQGLVGEQANGYLGVVSDSAAADVRALVNDVNQQRQQLYLERAQKAGVKPEIMELRTGERLLERAPAGEFIRTPDGRWVRK
jgi:uncharacterized protein YdbL (DUF1318 family)